MPPRAGRSRKGGVKVPPTGSIGERPGGTKRKSGARPDFSVVPDAVRETEAMAAAQEPFAVPHSRFLENQWPAIYGTNLEERRRQRIMQGLVENERRQLAVDDKTVNWIIQEQDRIQLIEQDALFEASAHDGGYFRTPQGLDYLHKIRPKYFERRRKMAEWIMKVQERLYNIKMNGIRDEDDYQFMVMLQGLDAAAKALINSPVHELNTIPQNVAGERGGGYLRGLFRRVWMPHAGNVNGVNGTGQRVGLGGVFDAAYAPPGVAGGATAGNTYLNNALGYAVRFGANPDAAGRVNADPQVFQGYRTADYLNP